MPSMETYRKRQIYAGILALGIVVTILVLPYAFAGLANYLNETFAAQDNKYVAMTEWDIDADRATPDEMSYYYWYNTSGDLNYNNITIVSGNLVVEDNSTAGNVLNSSTIDLKEGDPYYIVYWKDYTAKDALEDGLVRIRLKISGLTASEAHVITFYAGDVVLFTTSIAENEATTSINETFDVDIRDLMDAVIASPEKAYFKLKITNEPKFDDSISIAGSTAYKFNVANPVKLDTTLVVGGMLTAIVAFIAALFALPQYGLPNFKTVGKIGKRR